MLICVAWWPSEHLGLNPAGYLLLLLLLLPDSPPIGGGMSCGAHASIPPGITAYNSQAHVHGR